MTAPDPSSKDASAAGARCLDCGTPAPGHDNMACWLRTRTRPLLTVIVLCIAGGLAFTLIDTFLFDEPLTVGSVALDFLKAGSFLLLWLAWDWFDGRLSRATQPKRVRQQARGPRNPATPRDPHP